ncbi:MAG: hypothetical protein KGJ07_10415, partial [Patescibacteria group bacterium]|nr:hypothetical protein [Patescibacteria group bacterium]
RIMKKLLAIILLVIAGALSTQLVMAESVTMPSTQRASRAAERQENTLESLKARGDKLLTNRIDTLRKILTRVQNDKRLQPSDKSLLMSDINTTIANLTALQTKIDADTVITTTRSDVASIITSYRIYEIYEPKIFLLLVVDNLQTTDATLTSLSQKIQALFTKLNITDPKSAAALTDMNTQLGAISTLLATDKTLHTNVTVSTTDPKSIFAQVRKDLTTVRADFAKIRSDIAQIRSSIRNAINVAKPTVSSSSAK